MTQPQAATPAPEKPAVRRAGHIEKSPAAFADGAKGARGLGGCIAHMRQACAAIATIPRHGRREESHPIQAALEYRLASRRPSVADAYRFTTFVPAGAPPAARIGSRRAR